MRVIDLRSDTVTRPTPEMRQAMAQAEVGDDVYREDPTVNQLEERAAKIFGKGAGLFVPTGTMGNTIAIKLHTEHGQEVICDARGHLLDYELSMTAWFAGCVIRPVPTEDGILTWERIRPVLKPLGPHWAPTGCIEIENTHNMAGGTVYPQEVIDEIGDHAHEASVPVHMDGARVFHAATATGNPVSRICSKVDTVMFCLSKGLGAPVGSLLVGPSKLMEKARLYRKRLGGGMRQAGVLAAAGLIALEKMTQRLEDDHAEARYLADRLAAMDGISVIRPSTNIVIFDVAETGQPAAAVSEALKAKGVLINAIGPTRLRAVTHFDVSHSDCQAAMDAVEETVRATARS